MLAPSSPIGDALQTVRAELARVDAKTGTLLALAGTALTVVLAVLARTHLPAAATVTGWLSAGLVGAAVLTLALAIRPSLHGDHGFVRYARLSPAALQDEFAFLDPSRHPARQAEVLAALSRATLAKYRRIRGAVDLLLAGLAGIALTAALATLF